jgi:hypothetical protein
MLPDLPEPLARAWYARTLAAADSLGALGAMRGWSDRPVSAASSVARRRVAAFLRRAAVSVRAGRMSPRDFRRLRARLFGAVPTAGGAVSRGGSSGVGGGGPVLPPAVTATGSFTMPEGHSATAAANTAASAAMIPISGEA